MERFATIEIKNMGPTNPTPELPWWLNGLKKKKSACKQETWVQFLGQADPLEKEMATRSSILAWRIS